MRVSRITTYPVKSLQGTDHAAREAMGLGLLGDRRWAVFYPTGVAATRRELSILAKISVVETETGISLAHDGDHIDIDIPSGASITGYVFSTRIEGVEDAGNLASLFLSAALGREVRLAYFPNAPLRPVNDDNSPDHFTAFADGYPILLATAPSLNALNTGFDTPFSIRRFRPNLVIDGLFDPWAEDTWRLIRIGKAVLRVASPCDRCVMTTQDPDTGEQTDRREPLATLARLHRSAKGKICFGQNLVVEEEGTIVLGDEVELLETGPSNLL